MTVRILRTDGSASAQGRVPGGRASGRADAKHRAVHGVDLNHPATALTSLKNAAAGALDKHGLTELKFWLVLLNAARDTLNNALISSRATSMTLRRSLETIRHAPEPPVTKTEENQPEHDDAEHAHDVAVQALKFLFESLPRPSSSGNHCWTSSAVRFPRCSNSSDPIEAGRGAITTGA
jgi:hypothetical protein